MAEKLAKWTVVVAVLVLGLGLVLNPMLIPTLPKMLHYIIGGFLLIGSGYGVWKEVK